MAKLPTDNMSQEYSMSDTSISSPFNPTHSNSALLKKNNEKNKCPNNTQKYSRCDESKLILSNKDDNVICKIRRKRASNLVVYRAKTITTYDDDGKMNVKFHPKQQIEIFWLKLSQKDLKKHRESGKKDDRVELSAIEKKIAYGVHAKKIKNKNKQKHKSRWRSKSKSNTASTKSSTKAKVDDKIEKYKVTFNALKSLEMTLKIDAIDNKPRLYGKMIVNGNEIECKMHEIWVTIKKSRLGIPKIDYLTIKAYRCDDNQLIEHIMKKK